MAVRHSTAVPGRTPSAAAPVATMHLKVFPATFPTVLGLSSRSGGVADVRIFLNARFLRRCSRRCARRRSRRHSRACSSVWPRCSRLTFPNAVPDDAVDDALGARLQLGGHIDGACSRSAAPGARRCPPGPHAFLGRPRRWRSQTRLPDDVLDDALGACLQLGGHMDGACSRSGAPGALPPGVATMFLNARYTFPATFPTVFLDVRSRRCS